MNPTDIQIPKIALQLYTVRDELAKDFDSTLQQIAEIGFQYVEIADTGTLTIPEFTQRLKQFNLKPISTHVDFLLLRQNPQSFINEVKDSGINKMVVPWIDPQIWQDEPTLNQVLDELEQIGIQAEQQGITLSYHNHAHELATSGNVYLLDKLISQTQHVYLQLDLGWAYVATREDPFLIARRYNPRINLFHLKDVRSPDPVTFTELGNNGKINWKNVLQQILSMNAGEWIIEQDTDFEKNPLDSVKKSYQYLTSLF